MSQKMDFLACQDLSSDILDLARQLSIPSPVLASLPSVIASLPKLPLAALSKPDTAQKAWSEVTALLPTYAEDGGLPLLAATLGGACFTREEYGRLVTAAHTLGRERLALLLETICATGIRVSEVKYITVEAVQAGRVEIALKGKLRTILLPGKLCRKLKKYAKAQKTASGEIFLTKSGKSLSRKQIWAEMKRLCRKAGVAPSKVFPHNLRHLFARTFYRVCRDIVKLADVLGHSSVKTTRIYLISTGAEHAGILKKMSLIL